MAILLPQQDWVEQSCCHSRIGWSNPVATAGLTAGRVSGEKKHSVSDTAVMGFSGNPVATPGLSEQSCAHARIDGWACEW